MLKNGPNRSTKRSRAVKNGLYGQNGQYGQTRTKSGLKSSKIVRNGQKRSETVETEKINLKK